MKIVITLPEDKATQIDVERALDTMMQACGGCTVTQGRGVWHDGDVFIGESVELYHFCCPVPHLYSEYRRKAEAVVHAAIFCASEKAVLVEYYQPRGYSHTMYTKGDFNEQPV